MNPMKDIRIEKLTLNVGAGKNPDVLKKGTKLLKNITGLEPVKTVTQKRIPNWGLRPGLPIGCKITLRKAQAKELVGRLLEAKSRRLATNNFDGSGNVSFGVHEYIDVPGVKYDPEIGITGFQVCLTLERSGFRVKRRRIGKASIPKDHRISKEEAMAFMKSSFNVEVGDEE
jgi:large subunit ribosomal protein L5